MNHRSETRSALLLPVHVRQFEIIFTAIPHKITVVENENPIKWSTVANDEKACFFTIASEMSQNGRAQHFSTTRM